MSNDRRSRYYGLRELRDGNRVTTALRLLPEIASDGGFITHRLSAGETLDQLARRYYGRDDLWWRIADANPPRFPLDWKPGDVLRVPMTSQVTRVPRGGR